MTWVHRPALPVAMGVSQMATRDRWFLEIAALVWQHQEQTSLHERS